MKFITLLLLSGVVLASSTAIATRYTWVQYGADDKIIARAIIREKECPSITIYPTNLKIPFGSPEMSRSLYQPLIEIFEAR